ncbi:MAG: hypothetical protein AAB550_02195 [Patescibacteria group bacterium]
MTKKTFFDKHLDLSELEKHLSGDAELTVIVQRTMRNHVLSALLELMPKDKHHVFLKDFSQNPEDEKHWDVLREHIKDDVEKIVKTEVGRVKKEILKELK